MSTLEGRTALVTGGSRGIGLGIAQSLVDRGARVVLTARKADALAEAVDSLGGPEVAVARAGQRRGPRAPRRGRPDRDRDVRQPRHAGRQRRAQPGLRPADRSRPRRLPQDPGHQRRLLARAGAGGMAGLDGRARRLGAVRRLGRGPAVLGGHRRLRRQQGRGDQPDHPARRRARPDGAGQRGRPRRGEDPVRRGAVRGPGGGGGRGVPGRPARRRRRTSARRLPTCSATAPAGSPARRWCSTAAGSPAAAEPRLSSRRSTRARTSSDSSSSR